MTHRRHVFPGFTMVELLVVISIIALLISILLPALGSAREAARTATCLSNQKQMGVGIAAFQVDYDGYFPACERSGARWWYATLKPYFGVDSDSNNPESENSATGLCLSVGIAARRERSTIFDDLRVCALGRCRAVLARRPGVQHRSAARLGYRRSRNQYPIDHGPAHLQSPGVDRTDLAHRLGRSQFRHVGNRAESPCAKLQQPPRISPPGQHELAVCRRSCRVRVRRTA